MPDSWNCYVDCRYHEHKGRQELFIEANKDELGTLLDVAKIQSTGASNRIEGIYTTDKRLEELVHEKAEPCNRSEQEIAGYREVLSTIHENYEYMIPRPNIILQLHRDLYFYSKMAIGGSYKNSDNVIAEIDEKGFVVAFLQIRIYCRKIYQYGITDWKDKRHLLWGVAE